MEMVWFATFDMKLNNDNSLVSLGLGTVLVVNIKILVVQDQQHTARAFICSMVGGVWRGGQ